MKTVAARQRPDCENPDSPWRQERVAMMRQRYLEGRDLFTGEPLKPGSWEEHAWLMHAMQYGFGDEEEADVLV